MKFHLETVSSLNSSLNDYMMRKLKILCFKQLWFIFFVTYIKSAYYHINNTNYLSKKISVRSCGDWTQCSNNFCCLVSSYSFQENCHPHSSEILVICDSVTHYRWLKHSDITEPIIFPSRFRNRNTAIRVNVGGQTLKDTQTQGWGWSWGWGSHLGTHFETADIESWAERTGLQQDTG